MKRIERIAYEAAMKAVESNGALVDDQRHAIADAAAAVAYALGRTLQLMEENEPMDVKTHLKKSHIDQLMEDET